MFRWLLALVLLVPGQEKDFGKPYTVWVQAKTRWSTSFKKADFDKELKKNDDCLREKGRKEVPEDLAGWDEWTFEAAETWKYDIHLFERIFGKHIVIRRYDIAIEGTVTIDAQKMYWVHHARSGTKMKMANRPKLPKDKEDPPNVRAKIEAAMKEGKKFFRVYGEIIRNPTNVILLESAEPVEEEKN
ncbi:MAG TPA: hypothetical protein VJU16_00980 [Planctomycetota bacterium]|nr:hypothetical protein [Planctomycetota bacterium]